MSNYISRIKYEELTPDMRMIADVCGMEATRKLLCNLSGLTFYVPKVTRFENFILRYIEENSHKNFKIIAKELGVSEIHIISVLNRKKIT